MPRKRRVHPEESHRAPSTGRSPRPLPQSPPSPLDPPAASAHLPTVHHIACTMLAKRVSDGDGRYSVNVAGSSSFYHKWRWSAGPLSGRYVMFVHSLELSFAEGMIGLLDKVAQAETGAIYATLDRYK